ncbi:hypothetical protein PBI_INDLOVU_71 [Mycobacterium phage Indlovu]|nr:hypothetical protein PBI_INDLOVU_71 [Mycobacterium phage Indlovu]
MTIIDKRGHAPEPSQEELAQRHAEVDQLLQRARSIGSPTNEQVVTSLAQEGVRLADMFPDQKAAVARWLHNEAAKLYWRAQGLIGHDTYQAESLLRMRDGFLAKAEAIEADIAKAERAAKRRHLAVAR